MHKQPQPKREIKVIAEKGTTHRLQCALIRFSVSDGASLKEARVTVDFVKELIHVGNPFAKRISTFNLSEYDNAPGDLRMFVSHALNR